MSANQSNRVESDLINERLDGMTDLVRTLRRDGWDEVYGAKNDQYIRIRMTDYKAVSLKNKSALCRFVKGASTRLDTILKHFGKEAHDLPDEYGSRERRLQAWIIKQTLINNRNLLCATLFACIKDNDGMDELMFALDEISFGDIRCDIFAVGKKNGKAFPVVIELKYDRQLAVLGGQLDDAAGVIQKHADTFKVLFEEITGWNDISCHQPKKLIVWPKPGTKEREKTKMFREAHPEILFVEYDPMKFMEPDAVTFSTP